jgi:hypothetical protein
MAVEDLKLKKEIQILARSKWEHTIFRFSPGISLESLTALIRIDGSQTYIRAGYLARTESQSHIYGQLGSLENFKIISIIF